MLEGFGGVCALWSIAYLWLVCWDRTQPAKYNPELGLTLLVGFFFYLWGIFTIIGVFWEPVLGSMLENEFIATVLVGAALLVIAMFLGSIISKMRSAYD